VKSPGGLFDIIVLLPKKAVVYDMLKIKQCSKWLNYILLSTRKNISRVRDGWTYLLQNKSRRCRVSFIVG
jgi:hypothetical protein